MPMSTHEREKFLAEPHVAALSVAAGPARAPLTVPMWYQYAPGGEIWFLTEASSRKARLIDEAGRVSLMIDEAEERIRYVSVEGPVTRTAPGTDELLRELSARYLPADRAAHYVEFALAELGEQKIYFVQPERWLSADLTLT